MPELNLGVLDIPYADADTTPPPPRITRRGRVHKTDVKRAARAYQASADEGPSTTATVAQALEDKYHLFQVFYDQHADDIANAAIHSLEGALENVYLGAPLGDPFSEMGDEVAAGFRQWLLQGEIESLGIEGVPTKAALERRSGRFKSGVGPAERPSFISTGTFELSMRAWVD